MGTRTTRFQYRRSDRSDPMESFIEQTIAERIRELYITQLGQQPSLILCQQLEGKLMILLEDGLTQPERLLLAQGQTSLVRQVRDSLHSILQPKICSIIKSAHPAWGVAVVDLLINTQLATGRVSLIAVLSDR